MGTGLEMMFKLRALTCAMFGLGLLSACGNDPQAAENMAAAKNIKDLGVYLFTLGRPPAQPPVDPAVVREGLQQAGLPVYGISVEKLRYINFMAPYGDNGAVRTWASNTYETVSLRDGMLVATRGFGSDIMSSVTPGIAQVRSAGGGFHRVYYYLDGADQPQRVDFDCTFAAAGAEQVTVLDRAYTARRVTESCANPDTQFENAYWFDSAGTLRQSAQYVSDRAGTMQLQRVID